MTAQDDTALKKRVADLELSQGKLKRELSKVKEAVGLVEYREDITDWVGHQVQVTSARGQQFEGELLAVNKFNIRLKIKGKTKVFPKGNIESVMCLEE